MVINAVSVRRARKRCRRRSAMSAQQIRKVRCIGCKTIRSKATHRQGYCPSCWTSWLERRALLQYYSPIDDTDGEKPQCVECGAVAKLQGTDKFQGLGYCVPCAVAYLIEHEYFPQALTRSWCDECKIRPAEHHGKHEFSGLSYCKRCWKGWLKANSVSEDPRGDSITLSDDMVVDEAREKNTPACVECSMRPGVFHGRYEFQNLLYCGDCWLGWMECKAGGASDNEPIANADNAEQSDITLKNELTVNDDNGEQSDLTPAGFCVECKLRPGVHEGKMDFAGLLYCDECCEKWSEHLTLEVPAGPCAICQERPGEISGFNGFEGSAYCGQCWLEWQAEHVRQLTLICAECKKKPGESRGSNEFRNSLYCQDCFREYRTQLKESERDSDNATCDVCKIAAAAHRGTQDFEGKVYCKDCWIAWRDEKGLNELYKDWTPATIKQCGHFDFIEVGTSTWGTLSQYCLGDFENASALGAKIKSKLFNMYYARGLAIEPVSNHLAMLPSLPNVTKVCAAMDERSGENTLFYVSPANISKHMGKLFAALPSGDNPDVRVDVMWYAMSLSRVGQPHPELEHMLRSVERLDLLESKAVCVLSWEDLCVQHDVTSVDVVQLDCEGEDCAILRGMLAYCEHRPQSFPRVIQFEANHLTSKDEIEETLLALQQRGGYRVWSRNDYNIILQRNIASVPTKK